MKYLILTLCLTGCASSGGYHPSRSSNTEYIRNTQGQTVAKIQDGNIYKPDGTRIARIDSSGNIFNTQGTRLGKISK